jgi:hypothetical protein
MQRLLFAVALGIAVVGCTANARTGSDPVYPVSGVVSYGGQPVAGADVTFFNAEKNRSAFGRTNDRGEYKLTTFGSNDGAVEGTHTVTIVKLVVPPETTPAADVESEAYQPPRPGQSTQPEKPKSELPARYADRAKSGLVATISAEGRNEVDFELSN